MASALKGIGKFLFGSSPSTPQQPSTPAMPNPQQQPQGSAATNKNTDSPSFLAAAAPAPTAGSTGKATLLGQ